MLQPFFFLCIAFAAVFNQTLDHFHLPSIEGGLFIQQYWEVVTEDRAEIGFLILCGQGECENERKQVEFPLEVAEENQAVVYMLEHRYYGGSLPYGEASMLPQLFAYLEANQILDDIAQFISLKNDALHKKLKWVIVGGGYAGALAAWARTRFPDLITAAWASSAPVHSVLDYSQYDFQVYKSLSRVSEDCAAKIQGITAFADRLLAEEAVIPAFTDLLNATSLFENTPDGRPALWYFADMVGKLVEFGHASSLCSALSHSETIESSVQTVLKTAKKHSFSNPNFYAVNSLNSPIWTSKSSARQIYWQHCSQLGLFPTASNKHMRSSSLTVGFWAWYCNVVFGYPGGLPLPDVDRRNAMVDWHGTKIVFTNGSEDPWRWAGPVRSLEGCISLVADCVDCASRVDFRAAKDTDPESLKTLRDRIREVLKEWLAE